jgi:outer membrane protein assembly factor BamE (lipoprotein component of BamABCDE complex)
VRRSAPILLLTLGLLSACSYFEPPPQLRGNKVDADQLKELVPGTATRADAISLLGSPTAKATFDDNTWIYISEVTQPRVARIQGINSQNVVVLGFDDGGVLRSIKRLNQDDVQPVTVISRATPSPGSESSFMQQLLGNIGKFSAGASPTSGGSSGAGFGSK